jgi:N-acetyl-anhydromuramyl-L-alanine amidase AmpD
MSRKINKIVIHCSDTYPDMDIYAEDIRSWHVKRGWSDIGYHYVIPRDGVIEIGRDLDGDGETDEHIGAHALGHNKSSLGICMVGGKARPGKLQANFTRLQWKSLAELVGVLRGRYDIEASNVIGHNEVSNKSCPGFDVRAWMEGAT